MESASDAERFFLFTDIEGSTRLWEKFPLGMREALGRHDAILREAASRFEGEVFKTIGDAFCIAFPRPQGCLDAALFAQRALLSQDWGEVGAIKVRIALHGGEVEARDGDYFGPPLNKVSRLRDAGHGGQILATAALKDRLEEPEARWLDRGRHRLRGIEEPTHLFQLCDDDLPREFPALRTESAHPHNLPPETSSFLGRRAGLVAVRDLLTETQARLVTLTGLGGCGKSRLAIRAASDLLWRYEGGVWYFDAVTLSRADEFLAALLHACDLSEDPRKSPLQQLIERFKSVPALLVLDGAERFEELADDIAALLKGTEKLQVLATSRSLLYLSFEHEYPLDPLTLAESVDLFAERAIQVRHDFAVTDANRATIEKLCTRLEGIPLSIELAAAQSRTLSPAQILDALSRRFEVLSTRMRDLHPRHRSLRSAIDWSYQLLAPEEQRLFLRLSCFAGSFSAAAAAEICGALAEVPDVESTLASLRDKSLLRLDARVADEGDETRYTLTESARYLLQESLREFGEDALRSERETLAPLFERHGDYFQQLVRDQATALKGASQKLALATLERDAANIRNAQERFLDDGKIDDAARVAVGLGRFWEIRGWLREGRTRLERLLQRESALTDEATRAELLMTAGRLEWNGAEPERAAAYLKQCVALCESATFESARQTESMALTLLGMIAYSRGDLATSDTYYGQALERKAGLDDPAGEAALKTNLGINAMTRGDHERAMALFAECLAFRQSVGDTVREAHAWNCIGACALALEQPERATEAFDKSHSMYELLGDPIHAAHARINLGDLALRRGDRPTARNHYDSALLALAPLEEWRGITACRLGAASVALENGDLAEGRRHAREALQISQQRGYQESLADTLALLARIAASEGEDDRARRFLAASDALRREIGVPRSPAQERALAPLLAALGALPSLTETERADALTDAERYAAE